MSHSITRRIAYIGMIITLMSITATIKIHVYLVPISVQSFFPLLVGTVFDKKTAAISQLGYIILGLCGLPIFSNGGGVGYIFQPTFGYLLAMPIAAYFID